MSNFLKVFFSQVFLSQYLGPVITFFGKKITVLIYFTYIFLLIHNFSHVIKHNITPKNCKIKPFRIHQDAIYPSA